jgi:hypothetical protein
MKGKTNDPGLDMLSMYDQDVLLPLVFVVKELRAVLLYSINAMSGRKRVICGFDIPRNALDITTTKNLIT